MALWDDILPDNQFTNALLSSMNLGTVSTLEQTLGTKIGKNLGNAVQKLESKPTPISSVTSVSQDLYSSVTSSSNMVWIAGGGILLVAALLLLKKKGA